MNIFQAYQLLKQNPVQFLAQRRFNIPNTIDTSNSDNIIQYLLNSGQVSQNQINKAMSVRYDPQMQQMFGNNQNRY